MDKPKPKTLLLAKQEIIANFDSSQSVDKPGQQHQLENLETVIPSIAIAGIVGGAFV